MVMLQGDERIEIVPHLGYYVGVVDGEIVVSGDTWKEVHDDLMEMGYII